MTLSKNEIDERNIQYRDMKLEGLQYSTEYNNKNCFGYFGIPGEYSLWLDCHDSGKFSVMYICDSNHCEVAVTEFDTLDDAIFFVRLKYL